MSWRIVTVASRCKLECRLDYLVSRGEQTIKVHLSEIAVLIVENTAVSLTAALLCELTKRKIKVIFCDEKHNPYAELLPMSMRYDTSGQLQKQIHWATADCQRVWTSVIAQKIANQMALLRQNHHTQAADLLQSYLDELQPGDVTNREGHAAKVYFNALFGLEFTRQTDCAVNNALDYGYSILLSAVNRAVAALGYSPNLGIWHHNEFNHFNFSCDIMEPLRPLVDQYVLQLDVQQLDTDAKHRLQQVLNHEVLFGAKRYALHTALPLYVKSITVAIEQNAMPMFCTI